MSLINEALKKAQRQRSLENAPLSAAPSGIAAAAVATHDPAASRRASRAPLWFGLGLLALGSIVTAVLMRFGFPAETVAATTPSPTNTTLSSRPPSPGLAPETIAPPTPQPTQATPPATPVSPVPLPAFATTTARIPPTTTPPTPSPAGQAPGAAGNATRSTTPRLFVPPPEPAPPEPRPVAVSPVTTAPAPVALNSAAPDPRIRERLASLRITGIRGSGREARVLINERVWRVGDLVIPDLNLTLASVQPGLLVFQDPSGRLFERAL